MILFWIGIFLASISLATTWHVPDPVPSIQAALDSLGDGDTIRVEPGQYFETLQAPDGVSFVMLGVTDSTGRPVVDPTPLPGSTHLACLRLPSQSVTIIEDFVFRNGPAMFPRDLPDDVGGIWDEALSLTLRRCSFDSTYRGVYLPIEYPGEPTGHLMVEDCEFITNVNGCIRDRNSGPATVLHSSFSGTNLLGYFSDSTRVENCTFQAPADASEWIWLSGPGCSLKRCTFGPATTSYYDVVWTANSGGCTFEDNVFRDLGLTGAAIMLGALGNDTSYFRRNVFRNTRVTEGWAAGAGILLATQSPNPANIVVEENVFDSCRALNEIGWGSIYMSEVRATLADNHFTGPDIPMPNIRVLDSPEATINRCSFVHTGWALASDSPMNAEYNWWGDSAGPYHAQLNPDGLGDRITGPVDFDPWLDDSTELDSGESAPDPFAPLPQSSSLEIYPNPFNATATVQLTVSLPGAYVVELFNTLGRHVKELWAGKITGEKQIVVNGGSLPSGLYLVRVRQVSTDQTVAAAKVLLLK